MTHGIFLATFLNQMCPISRLKWAQFIKSGRGCKIFRALHVQLYLQPHHIIKIPRSAPEVTLSIEFCFVGEPQYHPWTVCPTKFHREFTLSRDN